MELHAIAYEASIRLKVKLTPLYIFLSRGMLTQINHLSYLGSPSTDRVPSAGLIIYM